MATGAGLSGVISAVLPLVGLVTLWTARRRRRKGADPAEDADFARKQGERAEMERRMASYLAQRGSNGVHPTDDDANEQEIRR